MAALRLSAALLLGALLAGASLYQRRQAVFLSAPVEERSVAVPLDCALLCDGRLDCSGFVHSADSECRMFDCVPRLASDPAAVEEGTFVRGTPVIPCPPGWLVLRQKCYLRFITEERHSWTEHRQTCRSFGQSSDLAVPTDALESSWLTYHPSRTEEAEYTGLKLQGGAFYDPDGSHISVSLQLPGNSPDPGYVNLKVDKDTEFFTRPDSVTLKASVCEMPRQECALEDRCPSGWLAVDNFCYYHVHSSMQWQGADDHCRLGVHPESRLSPVINMETFRVLHHGLSLPETVWAGLSDSEQEGVWRSVDGSESSLVWIQGEPDGGTNENCAAVGAAGLGDWKCHEQRQFLCRLPAAVCVEE